MNSLTLRRMIWRVALPILAFALTWTSGYASPKQQHRSRPPQPTIVLPAGWPKILSIARFGIRAAVEAIALKSFADEHAPYRWEDVAWWDGGPKPGEYGVAAVFGHFDSTCCPAIFYHLRDLRPGDVVSVTYSSGQTLDFRVIWSQDYWNDEVPYGFLYGPNPHRSMALLTCDGVFHTDGTGYDHKYFVYTRLILPNGQLG